MLTVSADGDALSHKFAQSTSLLQTTDLILLGDPEKVDENKAKFENSDNLNKISC